MKARKYKSFGLIKFTMDTCIFGLSMKNISKNIIWYHITPLQYNKRFVVVSSSSFHVITDK